MAEKTDKKKKQPNRFFKKERHILRYEISHVDTMILAILAILGSVMVFIGMKILLEKISILQDPVVMIIVGILILFLTGSFIKVSYKRE